MKWAKISKEASITKGSGGRLVFSGGDKKSMRDMLATVYRGDIVSGQFRMDWEHWPFQSKLIAQSTALMTVIDRLADIGRMVREKKERRVESYDE